MKRLLTLGLVVAALATVSLSAEAGHRHGFRSRWRSPRLNCGPYAPRLSGYGGYGGYGISHRTWHDTSHYDWHPGGLVPHGNHYDYIPGHYDLHRTGHWDVHVH